MKRLEIHLYNFPSTSHLKVIFYAFKKTTKYFGNKSEFFFWRQLQPLFNAVKCAELNSYFTDMKEEGLNCYNSDKT